MQETSRSPRYNQPIRQMLASMSGGLRRGWLTSFLLTVLLPAPGFASDLDDVARQLAHKIALVTGPGAIALDVANR